MRVFAGQYTFHDVKRALPTMNVSIDKHDMTIAKTFQVDIHFIMAELLLETDQVLVYNCLDEKKSPAHYKDVTGAVNVCMIDTAQA